MCSRQLLERGNEVVIVDDLSTGHAEAIPQGATFHRLSYGPGDPAVLCASPGKLKTELKWEPRFSDLKNIVRSAWEWKRSRTLIEA